MSMLTYILPSRLAPASQFLRACPTMGYSFDPVAGLPPGSLRQYARSYGSFNIRAQMGSG